jgi:hypothetical protein
MKHPHVPAIYLNPRDWDSIDNIPSQVQFKHIVEKILRDLKQQA